MGTHPIRGKRIVFAFRDGQMKGIAYEHHFHSDGTVSYGMVKGDEPTKIGAPVKCEVAKVRDDVYAISYLSKEGYTLSVVMDLESEKLVAFSSNAAEHQLQHGTFTISTKRPHQPMTRA